MNATCEVPGCQVPKHGSHWCNNHYRRFRRTGSALTPSQRTLSPQQLFWRHVNKTATCWLWTARITPQGYGRWCSSRAGFPNGVGAHQAAYSFTVGPVPSGLVLDHLCRVRHCVNPEHLEPVTLGENLRRGFRLITHCPQGHKYTEENTYLKGKNRNCRTCHRERERIRRVNERHPHG